MTTQTVCSVNNQQLEDKKKNRISYTFIWSCFFLYVFMMSSKNSYTAEMVELIEVFNSTKPDVSLAMTYYFVTYAVGQILLSFCMGKINLKVYLGVTAGISSILTIMIGLMKTLEPIYVLCAVNGALQAGIYSGCMQCLSRQLDKKLLPAANKIMALGTSFASVAAYAVPALFVALDKWNYPFFVLGALFLASVVFFIISYNKIKRYPPAIQNSAGKTVAVSDEKPFMTLQGKGKKIGFFAMMAFLTLIGNATYYGTFNWVPNLIKEVFHQGESLSILLTLLFPVVQAITSIWVVNLCEKYVNIIAVSFWLMVVAMVIFVPMLFVHDLNIVLTLVCMVAFTALAAGARQVFSGILAFKMRTQLSSGGYLAYTNAFAALAAGVIPPLAASVIEAEGYRTLFIIAMALSVIYMVIIGVWSLAHTGKIKKFKNK